MSKVDMNMAEIETPNIDFKDIEEMKKVEQEMKLAEEAEETVDFDLDEEEFNRGLKKGSYFAGILASMLTIGIPAELAVDVLINEETIAFNKNAMKKVEKENIIEEEINRM